MDSRITTKIAITTRRRRVLDYFNKTLNDLIWSSLYFRAASRDRAEITSKLHALTPEESSASEINALRKLIKEKAHYWDTDLEKRLFLMALFEINFNLLQIHKQIEVFDDTAIHHLLMAFDAQFNHLDQHHKEGYSALNSHLQLFFQSLQIFIQPTFSPEKIVGDKPPAPASELKIETAPTQVPKESDTKREKNEDPMPKEEKNEPEYHPHLHELFSHFKEATQILKDEGFTKEEIQNHPLTKAGIRAVKKLNKMIDKDIHLLETQPAFMHEKSADGYFLYFKSIIEWAANIEASLKKNSLEKTLSTESHESKGLELPSLEHKEVAKTGAFKHDQKEASSGEANASLEKKESIPAAIETKVSTESSTLPRTPIATTPKATDKKIKKMSFWESHPYLKWMILGFSFGVSLSTVAFLTSGMFFLTPVISFITSGFLSSISFVTTYLGIVKHTKASGREKVGISLPVNEPASTPASARTSTHCTLSFKKFFSKGIELQKVKPTSTAEIDKAIKALVYPESKTECERLFRFWNKCDGEPTALSYKATLTIKHHAVKLPESIAHITKLFLSRHTRHNVSAEVMKMPIVERDTIKLGPVDYFKITANNLETTLKQYGYKKTLCSIIYFRYPEISEKLELLSQLVIHVKKSPYFTEEITAAPANHDRSFQHRSESLSSTTLRPEPRP